MFSALIQRLPSGLLSGLPPLTGVAWDGEHVARAHFTADWRGRPRLNFCDSQRASLGTRGNKHSSKAWALALPEHDVHEMQISLPARTLGTEVAARVAAELLRDGRSHVSGPGSNEGTLCFDFHALGRAQDGAQSVAAYTAEREAVQHLCENALGAGGLPAVIEPALHSLARLAYWRQGARGAQALLLLERQAQFLALHVFTPEGQRFSQRSTLAATTSPQELSETCAGLWQDLQARLKTGAQVRLIWLVDGQADEETPAQIARALALPVQRLWPQMPHPAPAQQRALCIAAGLALRAFVPPGAALARINLLPGRAQRCERLRQARRNALSGSALCGLLLGFAFWGWAQSQWQRAQAQHTEQQQAQEQRKEAQARRSTAGDWDAARSGWARFFATMSQQTPAPLRWQLWQQSGESITLSGEAREPQAVLQFTHANEAANAAVSKLSTARTPGGAAAHFTLHLPAPWLKVALPPKSARNDEHHGSEH